MALTAKQSSTRAQYAAKLGALNSLAKHTGLIAPVAALTPSESELQNRLARHPGIAEACIKVISDHEADALNRAAAGMLLECFFPKWRATASAALVGMVVDRCSNETRLWRDRVISRDGCACTKCKATQKLEAHHIVRWADAPSLRIDIDNGTTLCKACHDKEHQKIT